MLMCWFDPFYFCELKLLFFHRVGGGSSDEVSNYHKGEHIVTLQKSQNSLLCVVYVLLE